MEKITTAYSEISVNTYNSEEELILAIPKTIKTKIQLKVAKIDTPTLDLTIKIFGGLNGTDFFTTPLETIDHAHTDEDCVYGVSIDTQDIAYLRIEFKCTDAYGFTITPTITNVVL
jgi:hypothetical protein